MQLVGRGGIPLAMCVPAVDSPKDNGCQFPSSHTDRLVYLVIRMITDYFVYRCVQNQTYISYMKDLHSYYNELNIRLTAQAEEGKVKKLIQKLELAVALQHRAKVRTMG